MNLSKHFTGALIAGDFVLSEQGETWENRNPYNWNENYFNWKEDPDLVLEAVEQASRAFPEWQALSFEKRAQFLQKLQKEFEQQADVIAELIARETGKAIWESRLEAKALASKIQISLETMMPAMKNLIELGFRENAQYMRWKPRGVCAVIGPFNFPLHLANGHIVPALLAGNSVIYKGSEQAPACGSFYASLFKKVGFPKSVFQFLPGGAETGKSLVANSQVKGVFFTGSYENGRRITESLLRTRKDLASIAALELGGKNASMIHQDADISKAVAETWMSSFASAGQRCSCSSRVFVHEKIFDSFATKFVDGAKAIVYGDPLSPETFMGPLINPPAAAQFLARLDTARQEGFKVLLESKQENASSCLVSPSVYQSLDPEKDTKQSSLQDEFFGPNAILIPYKDIDQMIEWHERSPYGLAASIFTKDRSLFDRVDQGIDVGLFNLNRSSVGASSALAFGGTKKSGNNWPAGIFSFFYCASPRSYLEDHSGLDSSTFPKGLQKSLEKLL